MIVGRAIAMLAAALLTGVLRTSGAPSRTMLGLQQARFTVNGQPAFLFGFSYYAALGASEATMRRDLDEMQRRGFNWIRVWATWAAFGNDVSAVDLVTGARREPFMSKLQWLVAECDRRGMLVDVTLSRGNSVTGRPKLQSMDAHRRAVESVITALRDQGNWYLDLGNERNIRDSRHVTIAELKELRARARQLAPRLLVTASHASGDLTRDELREYLFTVGVDFVAPHRPRNAESPPQTAVKTREWLAWMVELGRIVPVHFQEPFRRAYGRYNPTAEDFAADLRGAMAGGAAGWCFHNGDTRESPDGRPRRSFDLREQGVFEQLDAVEREALRRLEAMVSISPGRKTDISIRGDQFLLNGQPTYAGRTWQGMKIEGLLMNSRMVQGTFDDLNPDTVARWKYPDTGRWDAERNTREFLAAMPEWRRHGLLAFTLNLQGGNPRGYGGDQLLHNSAFTDDGELRGEYLSRLARILNRADELGMVAILGIFYFGQDQRLQDEAAVLRGFDAALDWVLEHGYRNVLIEVNNECNVRYDHEILKPERVHELITRGQAKIRNGRRLLVGTSYGGNTIPRENVVRTSDFLLIHGNGVSNPDRIAEMVRLTRAVPGYTAKPILFNEDDHFDFEKPNYNMRAAISEYASWGYFDPGQNDYHDGYQSPPVQWGLNTERKRAFFVKLKEVTGG